MNILGINEGHNSSAAILIDGWIVARNDGPLLLNHTIFTKHQSVAK
jgi:hypothetical protein